MSNPPSVRGSKQFYRIGEFAERSGVTERALRYYDRVGLLKPSYRSESGHRQYTDDDFIRLQQIVTLKFIGFSLDQIKNVVESRNVDLLSLLIMQKEWLKGKLHHLQTAIQAIEDAESHLQQGQGDDSETFRRLIRVIELQSKRNWENEFVDAATSNREMIAKTILEANSELSHLSIYTAVIVGDVETVRSMLDTNPFLATQQGGMKNWEPILYLSFSCFLKDPQSHDRFAETAQLLLDCGANPNAFYFDSGHPNRRKLSALYGAVGIANNPKVAQALLRAGANPNDGESLYHAAEFAEHECLELLYTHGVQINATPALFHKLDFDDEAGVQWFLEHGADPNLLLGKQRNSPLHWAVYRGRSVSVIELLLQHGADVNARRADGKTAYMLARRFGQTEVTELLHLYGAIEDVHLVDRFIGACATSDELVARAILGDNPSLVSTLLQEDQEMVIEFAQLNNIGAVRLMLHLGFDINVQRYEGTALHHAAWFGHLDMVKLLLEYGAPLDITNAHGGTPLNSAIHGSVHCRSGHGAYVEVVEMLIHSGSRVPERAGGNRGVYEVLRRCGSL